MDLCHAYTMARNEEVLIGYWCKAAKLYAQKLIVYDAGSTDLTVEIAKSFGADVRECPHSRDLCDETLVLWAQEAYKKSLGRARWVVWLDCDELLYFHDMVGLLKSYRESGITIPLVQGFSMLDDHLPTTSGQLWEEMPFGIEDSTYSKVAIFRPEIDIGWIPGKHGCNPKGRVVFSKPEIKLLHYRHLTSDYSVARSQGNHSRKSARNRECNYGFHTSPEWTGRYSSTWYHQVFARRVNVIKPNAISGTAAPDSELLGPK